MPDLIRVRKGTTSVRIVVFHVVAGVSGINGLKQSRYDGPTKGQGVRFCFHFEPVLGSVSSYCLKLSNYGAILDIKRTKLGVEPMAASP